VLFTEGMDPGRAEGGGTATGPVRYTYAVATCMYITILTADFIRYRKFDVRVRRCGRGVLQRNKHSMPSYDKLNPTNGTINEVQASYPGFHVHLAVAAQGHAGDDHAGEAKLPEVFH
jgi:hypothetical protein